MIKVEKINEVFIRVYADHDIEYELSEYFTFEIPGARFMPAYKAGIFDGKIRLYNLHTKTLYLGLLDYLRVFAERNQYDIEYINEVELDNIIEQDEVERFANDLDLHGKHGKIEIRDYQIEAIHTAIKKNRTILVSPTGSGKSLIIYTLIRWYIEEGKKCMIVVPSTSLVEQLYADFEDYSKLNGWSVSDNTQKLYSGFTREFTRNVLITTWQSIVRQPKDWFGQFDVLIGDEAHTFKAKSLTSIMEKLVNTKIKIGTTGTLSNDKINTLVLQGVFGPAHRVTTTKALMDNKKLAELKITSLILKYDEELRKNFKNMTYQQEMDLLVSNEKRNKFIRNLTLKCSGNTLLLFQYVEKHGKILNEMIAAKVTENRKVFFIHGGTHVSDREAIRKIVAQESDAIIIASFGVYSAGIDVPSIENIIFGSPSKSKIRNLQSIGRGLRLKEGKTHCNLYDIADDLSYKSWKNHTLKHAAERYKLYTEEQFSIKLVEIPI